MRLHLSIGVNALLALAACRTSAPVDRPAPPALVNATYAVADIVLPVTEFIAELDLPPGGFTPPESVPVAPIAHPMEPRVLEDLITLSIAPGTWTEGDGGVIRVTDRGTLVVRHTPDVQREVVQLLAGLRAQE